MSLSPLGRVVEIAEDGRYLSKYRGFVVVSAGGEEIGRVPLDDVAAVIATSPATTASCGLLSELAERGVPFVLCRRNFAPAALLWPVAGHHAQQRRMEAQVDRARELGGRLWAQVVVAKVRRQGWALVQAGAGSARVFDRLARLVEPGDAGNVEAWAARRYWPLMMGKTFHRDADGDGLNAMLNYGYVVLRGGTARAIVAAGLHPGIGIFHRHPQNAMPLADDLMEPFRPIVDVLARELWVGGVTEVTSEAKRVLAGVLGQEEMTAAARTPLSTCMMRLAASLADNFLSGAPGLEFPYVELGEGGDRSCE